MHLCARPEVCLNTEKNGNKRDGKIKDSRGFNATLSVWSKRVEEVWNGWNSSSWGGYRHGGSSYDSRCLKMNIILRKRWRRGKKNQVELDSKITLQACWVTVKGQLLPRLPLRSMNAPCFCVFNMSPCMALPHTLTQPQPYSLHSVDARALKGKEGKERTLPLQLAIFHSIFKCNILQNL